MGKDNAARGAILYSGMMSQTCCYTKPGDPVGLRAFVNPFRLCFVSLYIEGLKIVRAYHENIGRGYCEVKEERLDLIHSFKLSIAHLEEEVCYHPHAAYPTN